ncbi:hypothetical protein PF010_g14109 [Phytophthora fragariae]|uniref:Uncharacterized protein n=1 Tax=Phytophthora fragariae TaxID=53985 RepID=A0A6G0KYK3_9STRA|nr:hypothetical protein PF010_g14109 [Phytophthora fragariae]KAE9170092.1 hypothetical protein PF004_g27985 [Phytophthora fragariae]
MWKIHELFTSYAVCLVAVVGEEGERKLQESRQGRDLRHTGLGNVQCVCSAFLQRTSS